MIADNTSPLFWRCNCLDNVIRFSDDDVCERCGAREAESPNANVSLIQRFLPFIPVETVPQQILQGIIFAGDTTVHTGSDAHSRVEDAFFTLRELLREPYSPRQAMINQIQDLLRFYAQKYHVPITDLTDSWQAESWDHEGLAVVLPSNGTVTKNIADMVVLHEPAFAKFLPGDLITCDGVPVARIGKHWLVLMIWPKNPSALSFVRKLIDQHLPRLCREHRHQQKDVLIESIAACVQDRKRELQASIREDNYELERLSLQVMQLSRKLETDRHLLEMFQKSPEWTQRKSNRTFCDLMKLVQAVYQNFRFEDESVVGVTHPIDIEYDGYTYHFDSYEVEVNLRQGKVLIGGGTNVNGYVHPHVTDERSNVCWGNCGHLVSRLAGELDLFGLFQLVHQFLTSYNASDPYQKIERWDPDYEEPSDEEEPYCSFCDDYGHNIGECDSCWWCDHCNEYVDHDEEDCPNRPKEESEEVSHEPVAEQVAA